MLASHVHVSVAGGFAPATEQFHRLPPWATLATCNPAGRVSATVVMPEHGTLPTFVTVIVKADWCAFPVVPGLTLLLIARSHVSGAFLTLPKLKEVLGTGGSVTE